MKVLLLVISILTISQWTDATGFRLPDGGFNINNILTGCSGPDIPRAPIFIGDDGKFIPVPSR